MESFFSSPKSERIAGKIYCTRDHARAVSPAEFEMNAKSSAPPQPSAIEGREPEVERVWHETNKARLYQDGQARG